MEWELVTRETSLWWGRGHGSSAPVLKLQGRERKRLGVQLTLNGWWHCHLHMNDKFSERQRGGGRRIWSPTMLLNTSMSQKESYPISTRTETPTQSHSVYLFPWLCFCVLPLELHGTIKPTTSLCSMNSTNKSSNPRKGPWEAPFDSLSYVPVKGEAVFGGWDSWNLMLMPCRQGRHCVRL